MAAFSYIGRNEQGAQVKGTIEATSSTAVAEQLARQKIVPTKIEATKNSKEDSAGSANIDIGELLGMSSVSLDDLIVLCRQMYALMRSGVPILRAINGLAESTTSPKLKEVLT